MIRDVLIFMYIKIYSYLYGSVLSFSHRTNDYLIGFSNMGLVLREKKTFMPYCILGTRPDYIFFEYICFTI